MNEIESKVADALMRASTVISEDKKERLRDAIAVESNPNARWTLERILENAETAAYLAACLSVAVVREARDAQHDVGTIASAAATAEILIPAVRGITKALEVAIPVGLSFGVGIAADNADRRIEGAMTALLERIAERFEVPADAAPERLAHALDVFDERRDRLVQHWEDRP